MSYYNKKLSKKKPIKTPMSTATNSKILPPKQDPEVVHSEGTGNELLQQKTAKEKNTIKTPMSNTANSKFCRLNKNRK